MTAVLLLAVLLCRDPALVQMVYLEAGVDGVAVVEMESRFNPRAIRREGHGYTSWGLWQLDNQWHPQYRDDLAAHNREGARYLEECKEAANGDFALAVAFYNGGNHPGAYSRAWGKRVEAKRDALLSWLYLHLTK